MNDKEILKRMKEIRELLKEFGAKLAGFDPGVSAFVEHNSLDFGSHEWAWLEPLLIELRDYRQKGLK